MKRLILAAALVAAPLAAQAQDSGDGNDLLREGADKFLQGLLQDIQPPLQELAGIGAQHLAALQGFLDDMGPAFADVIDRIDSITYYEPPAILPNGDIIFRRRADAPPWTPSEATPDDSAPAEPAPRAPATPAPAQPSEPEQPWMRPPPAAEPEGGTLHLEPSGDMEL